ncbi:beta strand repeat-containing protein [Sphingomonas silueang]|uniref:beta strand repeat-containing protein n=1 Tax=Sphingomonas silueang TaxID=3156617 RepID=UPI0032B35918
MATATPRIAVPRLLLRTLMGTTVLIGIGAAQQAAAQTRVVSACSGVQLPPSVVTGIMSPVLTGITAPIESRVNQLLGIPLLGLGGATLNTNVTGLLNQAAAGQPITLQVLDTSGNVVGPNDQCRATSDQISLNTPAGISIGGNRITGLGAEGAVASAADINAIAFGNGAVASGTATGSIAFGFNSSVTAANSVALGAGSTAGRGAVANYAALGLAAPQTSAGEVSVGTAGGARQITNVAAGTAATDAATVGQLTGVANQVTALAGTAIQYDDATRARATLGGAGGTVLANVGAGAVTATSTEAVNGSQLFATNAQVGANTTAITTLQGQTANAVRYDADAAGVRTGGLTLVGATPGATVTVGNVGAGALTATSTEAVNGSQLFATNTQVGTNTNAIAGLDTRVTNNTNAIGGLDTRTTSNTTAIAGLDTRVTNNSTAIGGLDTRTTGNTNAIAGLDTRVTTNTTDIAALQGAVGNAVRYDTDAAGVRTGGVTFVGATPGATVTLGNVGAGALTATSTDAVNGSQLFATNTQVGTNTNAIAGLDTRTTNNTTAIAGLDTRTTSNTNAIAGLDTRVTTNTTDIAALQGAVGNAVRYDVDAAGNRTGGLTLVGSTPGATVTLGNVGAGALTATSTDAVNGSQLFATNTQVGANTTAIAGLDTRVTANTTAITNNTIAINALQGAGANTVRYDTDALGNRTGGVTFIGATPGANVTLANVGPGALDAASTQAVNGSQLFATNTQVGNNTTAITNLDGRVTSNTNAITTLQGTTANAVRYDVDAAGNRTGGITLVGAAPGQAVTIGNVAAGALSATSTDAVNGSQLFTTNQRLDGALTSIGGLDTRVTGNTNAIAALTLSAVQYDNAARDRLTFGGANGTLLANVAAGQLSATSRDAVNGSQLFATNTQVAANTAAIAQIGNGSAGPVRYSTAAAPTTPNGGTVTDELTLVGASGGAVGLHNVRAGNVGAGSTDAVNGDQLNTTNQAVAALGTRVTNTEGRLTTVENNVASLDTRVSNNTTQIASNTTAITNLQNNQAGTSTAITNLTTRVDNNTTAINNNTTAITNLQTQVGNAPIKYADAGSPTTPNGGTITDDTTLVGASGGPVGLHNVRAGVVAAGSTDAINGGQLAATNAQVASNTTAITNLSNIVTGSTVSAVQYSNPGSPTTPNGGVRTNDVTLIGANAAAPVGLHNVAGGSVAAGSTDAVNGGQLFAVSQQASNSIQYDRNAAGQRTNTITLAGGNAAAPVTIANVANGAVAAGSTQAVNGGQLFATQQTAQAALALGSNSVQYAADGGVTLGNGTTPVTVRNVAAGTAATDAVNVGQLQASMRNTFVEATNYIDSRLTQVGFDLRDMRRDMSAGSSAAMAVAALPQAMEPGKTMIAAGVGTYRGQSAMAFGASRAFNDGQAVVKFGGTIDSRGYAGANAGVGFQF